MQCTLATAHQNRSFESKKKKIVVHLKVRKKMVMTTAVVKYTDVQLTCKLCHTYSFGF